MFTSTKNRSPTSSSSRSRNSSGICSPLRTRHSALRRTRPRRRDTAFNSSRSSSVSSCSLSNRPPISGHSKPTCAARELSLNASSSAGTPDDTPASTDSGRSRLRLLAAAGFQPLLLLFRLQRFPVAQHIAGSIRLHVAKHVRMPVHQLVRQPVEHIVNREVPCPPAPSPHRTAPAAAGRPVRPSSSSQSRLSIASRTS